MKELDALPDHTETFLVVFSNYNYFYQEPMLDTSETKEQRYEQVGDAMCEWLRENTGDTRAFYAHPLHSKWITD